MSGDAPPPDALPITFVHKRAPALTSGDYLISVEQHLKNLHPQRDDGSDTIDESYINTRRFSVSGQRFTLQPADVAAMFPPLNQEGDYAGVLPHIVLSSRTLPWERSPGGAAGDAPWLALLLFDEAEAPLIQQIQLGDLQRDDFYRTADAKQKSRSTLAADTVSYPEAYAKTRRTFALETGENGYDPCTAIDVPVAVFNAIAPSLADLGWLAHGRTVPLARKAGAQALESGDFSIVVANRLPIAHGRCTVHLVSLEGLAAYLPAGDDYAPAAITLPAPDGRAAAHVRLVSLRSWSFGSNAPAQELADLLAKLRVGCLQHDTSDPDQTLDKTLKDAFNLGYTAINHHTREGDRTVSWYRGPFVPFAVPATIFVPVPDPSAPVEPIASADQVLRYDPGTGMFDVSYAAAWQLGRLLALQNRSFSTMFSKWKQSVDEKTALALEQHVLQARFDESLAQQPPEKLAPASTERLREAVVAFVAGPVQSAIQSTGDASRPATSRAGRTTPLLRARRTHFERLSALASSPERLAALHADTPVPAEIPKWLGRLKLLYGVPFNYLVPDEKMLPFESIRFFQIDRNWVYSLVEGACSIGRSGTADRARDAAFAARLHCDATRYAREVRTAAAADAPATESISGFLLRSSVVQGWPGLEVHACDVNKAPVKHVLRMERLAPTILLFICEETIGSIVIGGPTEGLHFAVTLSGIQLRYLTAPKNGGPDARPGRNIPDVFSGPVPCRGSRAVKIDPLAAMLRRALPPAAGGGPLPFTSAGFAVQLIDHPKSVRFANRPEHA